VGFQIENVKLLSPTAGIALPGAEITEEGRVDDLGTVGGEVAGAGLGHRESLREAAFDGDGVEAVVTEIEMFAERAKDDGLAVGSPTVDLIVIAPARSEGAARGIESKLLGDTASYGDDVDLLVAIVLAGEGDPFAVGRELGEYFDAGMRCEASSKAAGGGGQPEIAGVSENDFVAVDVGKAKKLCLAVGICCEAEGETQAQNGKELARRHGILSGARWFRRVRNQRKEFSRPA
jgi:hypothetical protein